MTLDEPKHCSMHKSDTPAMLPLAMTTLSAALHVPGTKQVSSVHALSSLQSLLSVQQLGSAGPKRQV